MTQFSSTLVLLSPKIINKSNNRPCFLPFPFIFVVNDVDFIRGKRYTNDR